MSRDVVILGAGMHPWGKGKNFVEYGVHAMSGIKRCWS